MGVTSRKSKHKSKMDRKREVKRARREAYASLAGTSRKSKRQGGHMAPSGHKHEHAMLNCGNAGCKRCHGKG
jgi:hypothetical protein